MTTKTPLERFQAKPGDAVAVIGAASAEERAVVGPLPTGATETEAVDAAAVVVTFARSRAELVQRYGEQLPALAGAKAVWYLYPKGNKADINRDGVAAEARAFGWRAVSNLAVDDVWSAIRVRPLKEGEE
ncbi:hypothetical protein P5G50_13545 [Leifsonia sp. F6_8S_P_1B]|uniref:DUF3052 domain-containing protein n=1 Tax=Leifsonia williamsii TaxID=3035919 RepID=A0ABT8KDC9_9MICO|nr:hypothetical protein [Leifsonia williamsii]MDN4615473.1 hypothetical protein [Leifsonia williamsii]